ncbi:rab-like protein 6 isoform X1 [Eptesicus fuscus]|uniref:rab-like protein 6 isoform X1 n=1 Tax=Eptesicus fuscus TaxID=29078 RepID=UPI002404197C|nr:rab-like protein 6 isoform X1 [Eptesicus fuscus]
MFSALKKLVGSEPAPGREKNIPAGLQSMNQALQRRFAKGVQYNMKIVIRGDRNTGKTALWHRLQGKKFVEEYIPTQEIQVTSIHWNYKTTDDIVKVEVWDVVDKGKCKKRGDGLKMENDPQEAESEMALDAEFLDVYKNCNGVVMMFDITKQWTFSYILRELPKVPTHVPVCVLGNYRDMGEHRVILPDDVRDLMDRLDRPPGSSYFRYAESSMKNSFGLKYLHKFFNIPFLQLQRETLLRQLETNQLDIDATLEELSVQQETEDQNYGIFLEMMEARSRGHTSPLAANGQSPSSGSQSPVVPVSAVSTGSSSPSTPQPAPQLPLPTPSACPSPPSPSEAPVPPAPPVAPAPAPRRSIISRLFGTSPAAEVAPPPPDPVPAAEAPAKVQDVEEFVPGDGLDHSFLDDVAPPKEERTVEAEVPQDSDSDGEAPGGNPMVAGFQDDVDLEDQPHSRPLLPTGPVSRETITLPNEEAAGPPTAAALAPQKCSEPETKQPSKAPRPHRRAEPCGPHAAGSSRGPSGRDELAASSESDAEGPIAAQMLSFVMDDPDFESDSDTPRRADEFPVREDLSDVTDEDTGPAPAPPPPRPPAPAFRVKDDLDLFGLGLEEPGRKIRRAGLPPRRRRRRRRKTRRRKKRRPRRRASTRRARTARRAARTGGSAGARGLRTSWRPSWGAGPQAAISAGEGTTRSSRPGTGCTHTAHALGHRARPVEGGQQASALWLLREGRRPRSPARLFTRQSALVTPSSSSPATACGQRGSLAAAPWAAHRVPALWAPLLPTPGSAGTSLGLLPGWCPVSHLLGGHQWSQNVLTHFLSSFHTQLQP